MLGANLMHPPLRVRTFMQSLLALRRDYALPNLPRPGEFPKTPEEIAAQSYDDAIRDVFLGLKHRGGYDFTYLPGINEVHFSNGRKVFLGERAHGAKP